MVAWEAWLDQNWFNLIQTLGIIASVWLTMIALRRDGRARKVGDYLALAKDHRELWSEVHRNEALARVLREHVDLIAHPLSDAETEFLNLAIVHFHSGWLLAKDDGLIPLDVLAADVRGFFNLPLPFEVWRATRDLRDPQFIHFIERSRKSQQCTPAA